jgi:hypothetical protein
MPRKLTPDIAMFTRTGHEAPMLGRFVHIRPGCHERLSALCSAFVEAAELRLGCPNPCRRREDGMKSAAACLKWPAPPEKAPVHRAISEHGRAAQPQSRRPPRRLRPTKAVTLIAEPTKECQAHRLGEADQERLG